MASQAELDAQIERLFTAAVLRSGGLLSPMRRYARRSSARMMVEAALAAWGPWAANFVYRYGLQSLEPEPQARLIEMLGALALPDKCTASLEEAEAPLVTGATQ